jgi:hypothetical protein
VQARRKFITRVQVNGQDVTPFVRLFDGVPVVVPVKLPRESVVTTPERMEPREIGFIRPDCIHLDQDERLWVYAEAFVLKIETETYCVRIMRTEHGVHMDIPKDHYYAPRRECPFKHTLPVLAVAIADTHDYEKE